ncbi:MAG: gliding motility-associated C-terminal domain-containing protein [Agriterribacter sp.]
MMKTNYTLLYTVFFISLFSNTASAQQGITAIYTDFNGYWSSSSTAISSIKPDNNHNVLGFTWNGTTYSTGVNDATLTAYGISFSALNFQAFPVRNITLAGTTALPAFGQLADGVDNGASSPAPFSLPPDISAFLTDGTKGLNIGTGVANIPANTLIFDFGGIIDPAKIGDGVPDILVTQIADPGGALDSVYFTDGSGVIVGNKVAVNHSAASVPVVGKWIVDFYAVNGTLAAGYTKTERPIRIWAADLSAFGINAGNYTSALNFRYKLSGSSDPAFLAFNAEIIEVTSANDDIANTNVDEPAAINVTANDQPSAILSLSSLQVTTAPAHGTTSVNTTTGVITYTPASGYSGIDQFSYQVCDNSTINPQCDVAFVTVNVGNADVAVTETASSMSPPVNSNITFTITAINNGANNTFGTEISTLLPNGYTFVSATTSAGSYNSSTGIWTIGNLTSGSNAVLQITALVNASGTYANTATISSDLFDPQSSNNTVTITPIPVAASSDRNVSKSVDNPSAPAGSNVVFTVTALNNGPSNTTGVTVNDILPSGYTYVSSATTQGTYNNAAGVWTIGDILNGSSAILTVTATVNATGAYQNTATISGTEADPDNANNSASVTVTPSVGLPVFAAGTGSSRCQDTGRIMYSASASNTTGITYSLSPISAGSINAITGEVIWNQSFSGIATVSASAAGHNGPSVSQHTVTVTALPVASVSYGGIPYCKTGSVAVTLTGQTGGSFSAASGLSINAATGEINLAASTPNTYEVTYNFSNNGCSNSTKTTIIINDIPTVVVTDPAFVCAPATINLALPAVTAASTPALTYTYFTDEQATIALPDYNAISESGTYYIKGTNASGCSDIKPVNAVIKSIALTLTSSTGAVISGSNFTLSTNADVDYEIFSWSPAAMFTNQTAKTQTAALKDSSATFTVVAVSEDGCTDTASVKVNLAGNAKDLFIPNAFTPNHDGRNDVFKVYGTTVTGAEIRIYTQWGALIYETNDNTKGWDGTSKGIAQPVGPYIYVVKVRTNDQDTFLKKGTVNLIR